MSGYLAVLLAALLHTFSYYMEFSIHFWYIAVFYQLVRLPELQRQYLPPLSGCLAGWLAAFLYTFSYYMEFSIHFLVYSCFLSAGPFARATAPIPAAFVLSHTQFWLSLQSCTNLNFVVISDSEQGCCPVWGCQ